MKTVIYFLKMIGIKYYFENTRCISSSNYNDNVNLPLMDKVTSPKIRDGIVKNYSTKNENMDKCNKEYPKQKFEVLDIMQVDVISNVDLSDNVKSILNIVRKEVDNINSLDELKNYVLNFKYCKLKFFANNTVFSDGNSNHPIVMVIGEAPGEQEDKNAKPFCGRSGALLDKILFSIKLHREKNTYITNTVFWRPPANRRPSQEEIEICRPIVEKHIALIMPKFILLTGNTAIRSLLAIDTQISKLQGKFINYTNRYLKTPIHTSALFHPSYLLRQSSKKKETWKNMLKIQKFLKEKRHL